MKRLLAACGPREIVATLGLGLIGYGLALVSLPAALVVTGALLFGLAVLPLLRAPRESN